MLALYEDLFLIAVHEEKGTLPAWAAEKLPPGLAGAMLCELGLMGKIKVKEKHHLEVLDETPCGDELLDEAVAEIRAVKQERKAQYWVTHLNFKPKKSYPRIVARLADKGLVTQEDDRLTWVIPAPGQPEGAPQAPQINASAKYLLKARLRAILLAGVEPSLRELALLGLLQACSLLELVVTRDERRLAARRIRELLLAEALKNPIAQTIDEIQEAVTLHLEDD